MATCPKCQLPNPETADACIWCGQHRFGPDAPRADAAVVAAVMAAGESPTDVTLGVGRPATPVMIAPMLPAPFVEPIVTPTTPPPEQKPLPSHVGLLFAAVPGKTYHGEPLPAPGTPVDSRFPRPGATHAGGSVVLTPAPATIPASAPPETPTPPPPPTVRPKLVVLRGQKPGHEFPVYDGRNVIGRFADKPVDVDLVGQEPDGQVWSSRHHAAVTFDKNVILVEDLNSLNGTWVNGARLHPGQQRQLKPNDVIQIGTVQLKVVIV